MTNCSTPRRQFLKIGSAALAMIPVVAFSDRAFAGTEDAIRARLKYQDKPQGNKKCSNCRLFVDGQQYKPYMVKYICKIMPLDTEISPSGYCLAWAENRG